MSKSTEGNPQARAPGPAQAEPPKARPIPLSRMAQMAHAVGDMLNVTLPEDDTIDEGLQDVVRWQAIGPRLAHNQWLQVTNDAGSFWRVMRVEMVHGSPNTGLRALVLRDIVPPRAFDRENDPIVATGGWYIRYGGPHRRWMVISPAGVVRRDGINTEGEAKTIMRLEEGNPRPL